MKPQEQQPNRCCCGGLSKKRFDAAAYFDFLSASRRCSRRQCPNLKKERGSVTRSRLICRTTCCGSQSRAPEIRTLPSRNKRLPIPANHANHFRREFARLTAASSESCQTVGTLSGAGPARLIKRRKGPAVTSIQFGPGHSRLYFQPFRFGQLALPFVERQELL